MSEVIGISLLTVVAVVIAVWAVKGDPTKYDEKTKRFRYDDVFVFPAEVKTVPKTALELANADDDDD